jgi:hypothetical protein
MVDQKAGRTRGARRYAVLALLLTAPLAALAGCTALPIATPDELPPALIPPLTHQLLLATPFQVLVSDEPLTADPTPVIAVQATKLALPPSAADISCGLAGIAQSIAHPADIWREVAPLHADSNTDACLKAAAAIEHLPEALAPVRWYQ